MKESQAMSPSTTARGSARSPGPSASSGPSSPRLGYSTFSSLGSAISNFWSPKPANGQASSAEAYMSDQQVEAGPSKRKESVGTVYFPGGWTTVAVQSSDASRVRLARQSSESGSESGQDEATFPVRMGGRTKQRSAIPFERAPAEATRASRSPSHSPSRSRDRGKPSPPSLSTALMDDSSTMSPLSSPTRTFQPAALHPKASDTALSSLYRLRAKSSIASLREQSFDNSFATVTSQVSSKWPQDTPEEAGSSWYFGSARQTPKAPHHATTSQTSIQPGAVPPRDWKAMLARTEMLDSHARRIVYQSGIDYEGRPIVVLTGVHLSNPREVDYDDLLSRIMDQMELFVQNDYTVIFFAGGGKHRPPWSWIWSSYRRLSRPFRKNCRRLYICHPTFFTRTLVQFVSTGSAILSPKFAKKITQCWNLSELAKHVELTQVEIPPEVLQHDLKYEKEIVIPPRGASKYLTEGPVQTARDIPAKQFGVPIEDFMGERGEKGGIPRVLRDCVEVLQHNSGDMGVSGLATEGIFRKSPSAALMTTAQQAYDRGSPVSLSEYGDPNICAGLLKLFFRSLPDPIFGASLYPAIQRCPTIADDDEDSTRDAISYIRGTLLPAVLPPCKVIVLSYMLELLHRTALLAETNKMNAANLATVWTPNLVKSNDALKDIAMCAVAGSAKMNPVMQLGPTLQPVGGSVNAFPSTSLGTIIKLCIERYYEIFEFDCMDYEPPIYHAETFHDLEDDVEGADEGSDDGLAADLQDALEDQEVMEDATHQGAVAPTKIPSTHRRQISSALSTTSGSNSASGSGFGLAASNAPATLDSPASSALRSSLPPRSPAGKGPPPVSRGVRSPSVSGSARRLSASKDGAALGSEGQDGGSSNMHVGLGLMHAKGLGNPLSVGRTASGSLKLTKARLGSATWEKSPTSAFFVVPSSADAANAAASAEASGVTAQSRPLLTTTTSLGSTSGVALTGLSAAGTFTRSASDLPHTAAEMDDLPSSTSVPRRSSVRSSAGSAIGLILNSNQPAATGGGTSRSRSSSLSFTALASGLGNSNGSGSGTATTGLSSDVASGVTAASSTSSSGKNSPVLNRGGNEGKLKAVEAPASPMLPPDQGPTDGEEATSSKEVQIVEPLVPVMPRPGVDAAKLVLTRRPLSDLKEDSFDDEAVAAEEVGSQAEEVAVVLAEAEAGPSDRVEVAPKE